MKVKAIQRFRGKEEKKYFEENDEFVTTKERGKHLADLKLVEEVKDDEETELTLKQLAAEVEKANAEELDALEEAESKGSNRAGAKKLFEKRRADLAEAEE